MNNVVNIFAHKAAVSNDVSKKLPPMDLEWWKSKNEKISQEFSLYDAHKKQVIMDEVLSMSDTMYEMIIDLRKQLGKSV